MGGASQYDGERSASAAPWLQNVESAKRTSRLPVVLTEAEVRQVRAGTQGTSALVLRLLYGTGMRVMECLRLRVKDVEFARHEIVIREGKGFRDHVTMLPASLADDVARRLGRVKTLHEHDLRHGQGEVYLPYALERKYPKAAKQWIWQYVFPSQRL